MGSLTRYFPGGAATMVGQSGFAAPSINPGAVQSPAIGGVGMPDLSKIFAERQRIEAEREARAARMQQLQMRALTQGMGRNAELGRQDDSDRLRHAMTEEQDARTKSAMGDLQLQAMQSEQQAAESGPPLRMVEGFNINPGYQPDTVRMNAIQRRMFLPNQSAEEGVFQRRY